MKHRSQPHLGVHAKPGIFETAWQFLLSCAFWTLVFVLTLLGIGFIAAHGEKIDVWMETQTMHLYGRSK